MKDPVQFRRFCEDPRLTLLGALEGTVGSEQQIDWRGVLQTNVNTLNQIPALELSQATATDIELLEKVKALCDQLISIARHPV
jgi:hypothetical protein